MRVALAGLLVVFPHYIAEQSTVIWENWTCRHNRTTFTNFSLNHQIYACNDWCFTRDEIFISFLSGDAVYGRVMVDPVQNLGSSFICNIEKVFLCTGADGYVPKYNPSNFEFGCLADAPSLLYRFKIIVSNKRIFLIVSRVLWAYSNFIVSCVILWLQDKAQPETQARVFGDVPFNAFLAVDDPGALALVRQPGSDGFRMDSTALFQVSKNKLKTHTKYFTGSKITNLWVIPEKTLHWNYLELT